MSSADWNLHELIVADRLGRVHRATPLSGGTPVALRFVSPEVVPSSEDRARLYRAAIRRGWIGHPHIAQPFAPFQEGECVYLPSELTEGITLDRYLLPPPQGHFQAEVFDIAHQMALALEEAHRRSPPLIHGHLSPANVHREAGTGRIRVFDFGLLGELRPADFGTPAYLSPELLYGDGLTPAADIFAWGLILFEGITRTPAVASADATLDTVRRVHSEGLIHLRTRTPLLPPQIAALIAETTASAPAMRVPNGMALVAALNRVTSVPRVNLSKRDHAEKGPAPSGTPTVPRERLLTPQLVGAVIAAVLLVFVVSWPTLLFDGLSRVLPLSVQAWFAQVGAIFALVILGFGFDLFVKQIYLRNRVEED